MPSNPDVEYSDEYSRARTWLKPNQVERLRDVCLSDAVGHVTDTLRDAAASYEVLEG